MNLTTDPRLWLTAALLLGTLFAMIAFTFGLMHATVQPRDR